MPKDLRSYLDDVADVRVDVRREVDPLANVGALCDQSEWPIVFHRVKGFPGWRLADRLVSRRELQARILGCTPDRVVQTLAGAIQRIAKATSRSCRPGRCSPSSTRVPRRISRRCRTRCTPRMTPARTSVPGSA